MSWQYEDTSEEERSERTHYEVIASFRNLEEMTSYVKEFLDVDVQFRKLSERMRLLQLRKSEVGGIVSEE